MEPIEMGRIRRSEGASPRRIGPFSSFALPIATIANCLCLSSPGIKYLFHDYRAHQP